MRPLVGLRLDGSTLTARDDLGPGEARLGEPVWGPAALLRDLELRLGLPTEEAPAMMRTQRWSARLARLCAGRFYERSYAVDPVATAETLLAWRDVLVEAGWDRRPVPNGGPRLEAIAELEAPGDPPLPPGAADRLARLEWELLEARSAPYEELAIAEPAELWPLRWRRIFGRLAALGVAVRVEAFSFDGAAPPDTDLGRLQALLRAKAVPAATPALRGDGTLLLLRADTSWEAAEALAALLRAQASSSTVVIRGGEPAALDGALAAQDLATQGVSLPSAWRPALQILPLAVELAFDPKDPVRALELLTLPIGPFHGLVGGTFAAALAEAPGIGGRPWCEAREVVRERIATAARRRLLDEGGDEALAVRTANEQAERALELVATWLEAPGHDATAGAPREALLTVARRVCDWLRGALGRGAPAPALAAAAAQAEAFVEALAGDPRERFDLLGARHLVESVTSGGQRMALAEEEAGRLDYVDAPGALMRSRDRVAWWHFVAGSERRVPRRPWRAGELRALGAAGVAFPDADEALREEADGWRRAVLAARRGLILVCPARAAGEPCDPHPLWDEIVARLRAREEDVGRITLRARDLLDGRAALPGLATPAVEAPGPLALPEARPAWALPAGLLAGASRSSASSLEALLGCPLRWVLSYRAGLRAGALFSLPGSVLLYGKLGHRLVEELHADGDLGRPLVVLARRAEERLDALLPLEGAPLLRPGMSFELLQLRRQLVGAVVGLAALVARGRFSIVAVEEAVECAWRGGTLAGFMDLLLRDASGGEAVIDLKWGRGRYRDLLAGGLALQLATYAFARRSASGAAALPRAGYFSLSRGRLLTTDAGAFDGAEVVDGPPLDETWARAERSVEAVERALAGGAVPVTGVRRSLPLLEAAAVPEAERPGHLEFPLEHSCGYCHFAALCGRRWEALS